MTRRLFAIVFILLAASSIWYLYSGTAKKSDNRIDLSKLGKTTNNPDLPPKPAINDKNKKIVLISLDTVKASSLSVYGYNKIPAKKSGTFPRTPWYSKMPTRRFRKPCQPIYQYLPGYTRKKPGTTATSGRITVVNLKPYREFLGKTAMPRLAFTVQRFFPRISTSILDLTM